MRTPYEQEIALRHLAQFQHDPTGYLQGLMGQALAHCYEVLLKGELDLQCQLSASATSRAAPARNGYSRKTMASSVGSIAIKVPRLRTGKFEPRLIPKYQRRPHAPEVSGAHALEVQVLHLCSCAIRAGMPAERHEFEQLFKRLELFRKLGVHGLSCAFIWGVQFVAESGRFEVECRRDVRRGQLFDYAQKNGQKTVYRARVHTLRCLEVGQGVIGAMYYAVCVDKKQRLFVHTSLRGCRFRLGDDAHGVGVTQLL